MMKKILTVILIVAGISITVSYLLALSDGEGWDWDDESEGWEESWDDNWGDPEDYLEEEEEEGDGYDYDDEPLAFDEDQNALDEEEEEGQRDDDIGQEENDGLLGAEGDLEGEQQGTPDSAERVKASKRRSGRQRFDQESLGGDGDMELPPGPEVEDSIPDQTGIEEDEEELGIEEPFDDLESEDFPSDEDPGLEDENFQP